MKKLKHIKYVTLDSEDGERSLKQHAFRPVVSEMNFTGELYVGNESLCTGIYAGNESENVEGWEQLENEPVSPKLCKICQRVIEKHKKQ